jgi:hypothetical protein
VPVKAPPNARRAALDAQRRPGRRVGAPMVSLCPWRLGTVGKADAMATDDSRDLPIHDQPWISVAGASVRVTHAAEWPERCVRCNCAGSSFRDLKVWWSPEWTILLLLVAPGIGAIAWFASRKNTVVRAVLCDACDRRALRLRRICAAAGLAVLISGCMVGSVGDTLRGWVLLAGLLLVPISFALPRGLSMRSVGKTMNLYGAGPAFVQSLPRWVGPLE